MRGDPSARLAFVGLLPLVAFLLAWQGDPGRSALDPARLDEPTAPASPRDEGARVTLGEAWLDGVGLHARATDGTEVRIALERLGRTDAMRPVERVGAPRVEATEVRLSCGDGVTEWWRSLPRGLEHGVTLGERPAGRGALWIELGVGPGVLVEATDDPDALRLRAERDGRELARYAELVVLDASGARVPARLAPRGRRIGIEIDDARARYPIVVDPMFYLAVEASLPAAISSRSDHRSDAAITASGDRAIVGLPEASGERGGALVLSRTGTSWREEATLAPAGAAPPEWYGQFVAVSADGARVALAGNRARFVVFQRTGTTWTERSSAALATPITDLAMSPDGARLYFGHSVGGPEVLAWSGSAWIAEAFTPPVAAGACLLGSFSPDGGRLLCASPTVMVARTFVRSGATWSAEAMLDLAPHLPGAPASVALARDRAFVASEGLTDRSIAVFVLAGGTWTHEATLLGTPLLGDVTRVQASSDAAVAVASTENWMVPFVRSGSTWTALERQGAGRAAVSADGARVVALDLSALRAVIHRIAPGLGGGETCSSGTECLSGRCQASVCCDVGCGACGRCDATGACTPLAAGFECRRAANSCDQAEVCDGVSGECPADAWLAEGAACTGSVGLPEAAACAVETCGPPPPPNPLSWPLECRPTWRPDGAACTYPDPSVAGCVESASCVWIDPVGPVVACTPVWRAVGTPCTGDAFACATGSTCAAAGTARRCEPTGPLPAGTPCRPALDLCDAAETCDGTAFECPADALLTGTECRAAAGECDLAERCVGTSPSCPPDDLASAGVLCRASIDLACDPLEACDGASPSCPIDVNTCAARPDASSATDGGGSASPPAVTGCGCRAPGRPPERVALGLVSTALLAFLGAARCLGERRRRPAAR